jgi:hypothetical protein
MQERSQEIREELKPVSLGRAAFSDSRLKYIRIVYLPLQVCVLRIELARPRPIALSPPLLPA